MARTLTDTAKDPLAKLQEDAKRESKISAGLNEVEKMLNTRVPASLLKRIKIYGLANDVSIKAFVIETLDDRLKASGF
jgi:predicted HicB family RNase H-like nuclease